MLQPWSHLQPPLRLCRLLGRLRPNQPRVDVPALRHCTAVVLIQVDTVLFVSRYDLLKADVLLQPCWGLGHATVALGAQ
jgi:hypothetical protein